LDTGLIVLVELVIILAGVIAFAVWEIRSVRKDRGKG